MFGLIVVAAAVPTVIASQHSANKAAAAVHASLPPDTSSAALIRGAPPGSSVYELSGTATLLTLRVTGGHPPLNGTDVATGTSDVSGRLVKGRPAAPITFGSGALISRDTYAPPVFTSNLTVLLPGGTLHALLRAGASGGGRALAFSGTGRLVPGSTGAYAGATGSVRFAGTQDIRTSYRTDTLAVTMVLPKR